MAAKQVRAQYTQEFKLEAVRQVRAGQAQSVVAKVLGIPKASLGSWVRLAAKGELQTDVADVKAAKVTPEQMEIARLRAEVARLRMERDIAKNVQRDGAPSQWKETLGASTLNRSDCGRQLFGGIRPRQKTCPLGTLRTQLWWRLVRPRLGK